MASRVKEDEKNERAIRELLKLPANRRCINCNSLGPQYVCTNFWTFICINCSGIHREFTHRVKSISMAKFSSEEVSSLQQGGNECAREIYFKEWDAQRYSFPDSSNIVRLREFIKHVYMDRRYTGERSSSRSPRSKGDNEDPYDKKKLDSYHGSRSPTYNDMDVQRYGERPSSTSPRYEFNPGRFDRDDKSGKNHQTPGGQKLEGRSPSQQKEIDISKSPVTQPIGAVVNFPPPLSSESTKSTGIQDELTKFTGLQFPHNSPQFQSTVSGSSVGISAELKAASSRSLIDFDADPGPDSVRATDQFITHQTTTSPAEGGGWASFDDSSSLKPTQVTSMGSPAESFLYQLSIPQIASTADPAHSVVAGTISLSNQSNPVQLSISHQNHSSLFEVPNVSSNPPFSTSISGPPYNPVSPIVHGLVSAITGQSSQVVNTPNHQSTTGISQQPINAVARPGTRKELPPDLFTMTYPSSFGPFPYYQTPQPYMGYGMQVQYPSSIAMPTFAHSLTHANPFALAEEPRLVHASTFPNLAPLQAALPNVDGHSSILRTSSLPTQQWLAQQQTPMSTVPQGAFSSFDDHSYFVRTSSFPTQQWLPPQQIPMPTMPRGPNVVQQGARHVAVAPSSSMFSAMHQSGGFNMEGLALNQHLDSRNYPSHTPTSSPGGNPFG
ncbi:probable ADP-ribosylation factor GTPase-activating protein AGD14 isoform X1 [Zingiber officinale]|uniref:probable ADP-ribosylation factor GTPase-activating protein AGD14 isoform X1 n=1 Tax=Zingiber officinale TaxID=94328 RepID=UPI001C4B2D27|nr:probable ADP-ribosylation factor GTPase-activating protein AGD14 isoform X1 [Zingiber officinale]